MDRSAEGRILEHPILGIPDGEWIEFAFDGVPVRARAGEPVTSALMAAGMSVFGRHERGGAPQGIFCANGQCAKCLVLADGVPVKGCMTPAKPGMDVRSIDGSPPLPADDRRLPKSDIEVLRPEVLIIGGGPAGISAAVELGRAGVRTLLVDDKGRLGGKLVLQTHAFFGSISDCQAGTRGIDIAENLAGEISKLESVSVMLNTACVGVFCDGTLGLDSAGRYVLAKPEVLLNAAGAREKALAFPGCDLPGVYGAGAFQTLVNRDLVMASKRLFIIGGGNVGLIAAYHALQAGIKVVGLAEAMPRVGGYLVHRDKIARLGVPVHVSHSIIAAEGREKLESVVIAAIDKDWKPVRGTFRRFEVDTLLIAVGLNPVSEMAEKAREYGMKVLSAGDAEEIAEASAAMFSGKIRGLEAARILGRGGDIPKTWHALLAVLKQPGGRVHDAKITGGSGARYPVFRCFQEIPCNPCIDVCPKNSISIPSGLITGLPAFSGECTGCGKCASICPGLAITIVREDYDETRKLALVTVPFEMNRALVRTGDVVDAVDASGAPACKARISAVRDRKFQDRRLLVELEVPFEKRLDVAGFVLQEREEGTPCEYGADAGSAIVCKCERVTRAEIEAEIRAGATDMNELKARLRCLMGACGGKTCTDEIKRIFRSLGTANPAPNEPRPFYSEIPLGRLAGEEPDGSKG